MSVIERSSNSFVTSTPKPQASDTSSAFLATLRGPHSTHRMMYRLRVSEGRIGKLRVCVLPQSRMKMFEIIVFDIKPLCMHWRADADGEVDDDTSYTGPSGEKRRKAKAVEQASKHERTMRSIICLRISRIRGNGSFTQHLQVKMATGTNIGRAKVVGE